MSAPRSFILIAIAFLLWNLMGIASFVMQYLMDLNALAKTDPGGAQIFAAMPAWLWLDYGIAVLAGFGGALFLLLRLTASTEHAADVDFWREAQLESGDALSARLEAEAHGDADGDGDAAAPRKRRRRRRSGSAVAASD